MWATGLSVMVDCVIVFSIFRFCTFHFYLLSVTSLLTNGQIWSNFGPLLVELNKRARGLGLSIQILGAPAQRKFAMPMCHAHYYKPHTVAPTVLMIVKKS